MKNNKKNNEEMMFLGVDGFEEIESLAPVKEWETADTTESVVKQSVTRSLKERLSKLTKKLKSTKVLRASKTKPAQKHSADGAREHTIYKKRAILAVAACATAIMLSFATVASAVGGNPAPQSEQKATVAPSTTATQEPVSFNMGVSDLTEATAYSLYIDGQYMGSVLSGDELQAKLDGMLDEATAGYDDSTTAAFVNDIEIKPTDKIDDMMTTDLLFGIVKNRLSVALQTNWTYEEETPFESEITYDDTMPAGQEEITQEGVNGVTRITIRLTYTNGMQTDAEVIEDKVVTEVVNEKKTVGTKEASSGSESTGSDTSSSGSSGSSKSSGSGASTGGFIWPVTHTHAITSYMEERWGRMHNGIDIAGGDDYGQPIIASDGGVVTFAGNDGGGYGNYVMIDHGNGYMTVYGHASELACETGQYVGQGETIAYVGSTGNSTGPHLHFEIRLNGEYQDPLNYVS